jgi:hypothetical protein
VLLQNISFRPNQGGLHDLAPPRSLSRLDPISVEGNQNFIRAWCRLGSAPFVGFGVAAQMLLTDVAGYIFGSANDDDRQNMRVGVDLHWGRVVGHGSCFTPLGWNYVGILDFGFWIEEGRSKIQNRQSKIGLPKTKATLLLFLPRFLGHGKVRVASGVVNCPLALRTGTQF